MTGAIMTRMKEFVKRRLPWVFVLSLLILGVFTEYFFPNDLSYENSNLVLESQASIWIDKVDRLVLLPKDELPSVAVVSDAEILKSQNFFKDAKRGDIVLIYANSQKAFLYDPKEDRVVSMASIKLGDSNLSKWSSAEGDNEESLPPTTSGFENQF